MSAYRPGLAHLLAAMQPGPALLGADPYGSAVDPYAFGAADESEAMQFGADVDEMVGYGANLRAASQRAQQLMMQRRNNWCQQHGWQRGGGFAHPQPGQRPGFRPPQSLVLRSPIAFRGDEEFGADDGFGADDFLDGVDAEELGGIDDEIAALDSDPEVMGADGDEQLGAVAAGLENQIERLERLRNRLEAKLAALPQRRRKKREALAKRIRTIGDKIERKTLRLRQKREKALIKAGIPAGQAAMIAAGGAAGGAAAAAAGVSPLALRKAEAAVASSQLAAQEGYMAQYGPVNVPGGGTIMEIPFVYQTTGESDPVFTKTAGAAGNQTVELETDSISFADFIPLGIEVSVYVNGGSATDVLPSALVTNWEINGGLNQVYGDQSVSQLSNNNGVCMFRTFLPALRDVRGKLNRTNTATLTLSIGNKQDNAASIRFKVEAKLRVRVFTDDNVR